MTTTLRQLVKRHRQLPMPDMNCCKCGHTLAVGDALVVCDTCFENAGEVGSNGEDEAAVIRETYARDLAFVWRYHGTVDAKECLERILGELDPAWRTLA